MIGIVTFLEKWEVALNLSLNRKDHFLITSLQVSKLRHGLDDSSSIQDWRILPNPITPVGRRTTSRRKYSLLVLDFACIVSFGWRKHYVAVVRGTFIDIDHSVIYFSLQSGIQKFDFNWLRNSAVTANLYSKRWGTIKPFINMLADLLYCIYINKNSYVHPAPTTTFNIHPYV